LNWVVCDDRDVVDDFRQVWEQLGDFRARLPVLLELKRRAEQLRGAFDEREALALDVLRRNVLPVVLGQRRLGIEQIELRRRTRHEEIDDAFGSRRELQAGR
jgi:hypothetical protein